MAEPVTTLAGIKGLFATAKASAAKTEETRKGIIDGAKAAYQASPTQFAKDSMLRSRAYVDGTLLDEIEIVKNILRSAHGTWIALLFNILEKTAPSIPTPDGYETVTDRLGILATEHWDAVGLDTVSFFEAYCKGDITSLEASRTAQDFQKSLDRQYKKEKAGSYRGSERRKDMETEEEADRKKVQEDFNARYGKTGVGEEKENVLPYGRRVEFTIMVEAPQRPIPVKVVLFVQMVPLLISPDLIGEFVKLKAKLSLLKRLTMWRAGEIKFWRDLVFQFDEFDRMKKVARADKEGVFTDFFRRTAMQSMGRAKNFRSAFKKDPKRISRNLVNTVLIFSEQTIVRVKAETGFDLRDFADRERYFRETNSMLIYIVDPMFNKVTLFMNGINGVGEYTFDMFKPKGKQNEVVDIIKAIGEMEANKAPRF